MSEYRQDRATGTWVIIAPERGRRPHQPDARNVSAGAATRFDPSCPFCPGNEHMLPGIIEESPKSEPPGWRTRVVPNKYPAVSPEAGPVLAHAVAGPALAGYGYHEVIIENGRHDGDLTTLSGSDLTAIVQTYRRRYVELLTRPAITSVLLFRNRGRRAGASLIHPHAQVIATSVASPRLVAAAAWARSYYSRHRRCAACDELERELDDGRRVLEVTRHFLVVVPFAAGSAFEQWILPRRHQASFDQIDDGELVDFAGLLQRALQRLEIAADDPPYNFILESGPTAPADALSMHWGLRIVPELVTPGGFELGAGLPINPRWPEGDAEALRATALPAKRDAT